MTETSLELAQRHVRLGAELIARQEALLDELERDGHVGLLPKAQETLVNLRETQRLHETHLADHPFKAKQEQQASDRSSAPE